MHSAVVSYWCQNALVWVAAFWKSCRFAAWRKAGMDFAYCFGREGYHCLAAGTVGAGYPGLH